MARFQGIPIKRDSADRAALKRAEALLKRGEPLVVFPEGRLSEDGKHCSASSRARPCCPFARARPLFRSDFQNTNQIIPYGSLTPRFSRDPVIVTFGPPIRPQDFAASAAQPGDWSHHTETGR